MSVRPVTRITLITLIFSMISTSCYDSTWGETKRGQARNAKAALPASLEPRTEAPRLAPAAHVVRVRIYATPSYVSQTIDWQKRIRDLLEDTNDVLTSDLAIKLEAESMSSWTDAGPEDQLSDVLRALHAKDAGDDVDWVAGFIGGIPKTDPSAHELGMSDEPGKHIVLRAISSASEHDAIDHNFDQLSEDQRMTLSRKRKQHRATSVLLHEIGHTLAAVHERDPRSIMNPSYDSRMSAFSSDALSLMHVSLAHRDHLATSQDVQSYAQALLGILQGPSANAWIRADRDDLIQRLEQTTSSAATAPTPSPTTTQLVPPPPATALTADEPLLSAADQPVYKHASALLQAGDARAAADVAKPLFSAYPKVYSIQDLRCRIALKRDGWPAAQRECKAMVVR